MPNTELLKQTLAHIEAHPNQWAQERWVTKTDCGTSYCFAGWALTLSQVPIERIGTDAVVRIERLNTALPKERAIPPEDADYAGFIAVSYAAEALLGLEGTELRDKEDGERYSAADVLFKCDNDLNDLREYVAELVSEPEPASAP